MSRKTDKNKQCKRKTHRSERTKAAPPNKVAAASHQWVANEAAIHHCELDPTVDRPLSGSGKPEAGKSVPSATPPEVQLGRREYANEKIEAAVTAFHRDLPDLLKQHPGKWVAYRGSQQGAQQVGIAEDDFELYRQCYARGYRLSEFIVECIEPQTSDSIMVGPGLMEEIARSENGA